MTPDQIVLLSLFVAGASLVASIIALWVAWFGIRRADNNSSASLLVTLNDGFRQAWQRYLSGKNDEQKQYELAELMNLLEIACALYNGGSLSGMSRKIVEELCSARTSSVPDVHENARVRSNGCNSCFCVPQAQDRG